MATAVFPLTTNPPPEPSTFAAQTRGFMRVDDTSRAFIFGILMLVGALHPPSAFTFAALAAAMPLAWFVGIVPQLSALVPFVLEQALQFLFGGLPPATYKWLVMHVATGLCTWGLVVAVLDHGTGDSVLVAAVSLAGAYAMVTAAKAPALLIGSTAVQVCQRR